MAQKDCIPYGSDVSSGKFRCADCGHMMDMGSADSLPPCPNAGDGSHTQNCWTAVTGKGDAPEDPYPAQ